MGDSRGERRPYVVGIDPGYSGALAWIHLDDGSLFKTFLFNAKLRGEPFIRQIIDELAGVTGRPFEVVLEHQQTFGGQETQHSDRRILLYGRIIGALQACGFKIIAVRPQTWQAHYKLSAGMPKANRDMDPKARAKIRAERHKDLKQRSIKMARAIFGQHHALNDAEADAALLGRYRVDTMSLQKKRRAGLAPSWSRPCSST